MRILTSFISEGFHLPIVWALPSPPAARLAFFFFPPLALSPSVNAVVPKGQVLSQALAWARDLVANSPDAVQSTKRGIVLAWQHGNVETATLAHAWATESKRTYKGENIKVRFPISCFASLAAVYVYRSSHRVGSRCTPSSAGGFFILLVCERK